ncbi:phenol 2-monooxygenase [Phycicoccus sp. HDW14]|uniref:phenol 2-monooxygenase n=1 Tax=Phycicoccus sp. HDW14 TaxID=2714941 RepID=UPI00140C1BF2|nr:phenol 2-monooxygenase [Phycicoccus sp. HDW14]QIM21862.1 phenol 2-monooxygenase [Phycicoccus sp. HDW14]
MQYELRTQVIDPPRKTFDHLVRRYGDRPASRYEEGTIDIQAKENFHYRPLWDPAHDIYDEAYSAFRLTDPYSFTDPRQYYYAPYVTSRAAMADAVAATLDYLDSRDLLSRLPDAWSSVMGELLVPLRHYESGAQMVSCDIARFGFGTTITQCAAYAAFDRIGNAQALSRVGIALGGGTAELLADAKTRWVEDASLQGLRRYVEELFLEKDWGRALVRLDVADRLVYGLFFAHLDDAAIDQGAGSYSLVAQHLSSWFADQRKWVEALYKAWVTDPGTGAANTQLLAVTTTEALAAALVALGPVAARADELVGAAAAASLDATATTIRDAVAALTA